jgi:hypothetical protein
LFQIVVPSNSTIGFGSNLKWFLFRRCRRFSPNFSIIGFVVRELHLPEKWSSWKDFYDKASRVLFQIFVPSRSTVGFVSNLKQFLFRRCKLFSPHFSIIEFAVKELHLLEVEGVEFVCFFFNLSK